MLFTAWPKFWSTYRSNDFSVSENLPSTYLELRQFSSFRKSFQGSTKTLGFLQQTNFRRWKHLKSLYCGKHHIFLFSKKLAISIYTADVAFGASSESPSNSISFCFKHVWFCMCLPVRITVAPTRIGLFATTIHFFLCSTIKLFFHL